jgi:hypothetical protein
MLRSFKFVIKKISGGKVVKLLPAETNTQKEG